MRSLNGGDKIEIEYYSGGNYRRVSGQFICIDIIKRVICIGAFSVPLDDVIRVKKIL